MKFKRATRSRQLSRWGKARAGDRQDRPCRRHEDTADGTGGYHVCWSDFAYAAELLKLHAPHVTDQPIIAQMKQIGLEAGRSFESDKLDPL